MSDERDLGRLNAELNTRLRRILDEAPPELRARLEETAKAPRRAQTIVVTLKDAASAAQAAVRDLEAARAKAELAMAELNKVKERSKIPLWLTAVVIGGLVSYFVYLVAAHS